MIRSLRSFGAFSYDFVIGDDWRGAAAVVLALALTALLVHAAGLDASSLLRSSRSPLSAGLSAPHRQRALTG